MELYYTDHLPQKAVTEFWVKDSSEYSQNDYSEHKAFCVKPEYLRPGHYLFPMIQT